MLLLRDASSPRPPPRCTTQLCACALSLTRAYAEKNPNAHKHTCTKASSCAHGAAEQHSTPACIVCIDRHLEYGWNNRIAAGVAPQPFTRRIMQLDLEDCHFPCSSADQPRPVPTQLHCTHARTPAQHLAPARACMNCTHHCTHMEGGGGGRGCTGQLGRWEKPIYTRTQWWQERRAAAD